MIKKYEKVVFILNSMCLLFVICFLGYMTYIFATNTCQYEDIINRNDNIFSDQCQEYARNKQ